MPAQYRIVAHNAVLRRQYHAAVFFSWVQNLIPASLKFGWESNFTYAAIFSEKYRTKGAANQNLVENQISQILHMLPFFARRSEEHTSELQSL